MLINTLIEKSKIHEDNIAIKTNNGEITYQELNLWTNNLAKEITEIYHLEEQPCFRSVALLFDQKQEMIIGTLAAVKANITYVPLENTYPAARLQHIINEANVRIILVDSETSGMARALMKETGSDIKIISIADEKYKMTACEWMNSNIENEIAYILFTSGSTGKPKGVYQSYDNLTYFINEYIDKLQITNNDKMTLFSSIGHDASLVDIYSAMLSGATLYPVDIKTISSFEEISKWLHDEKITIWHSTPTVYRYWMKSKQYEEVFPYLRYIVLGGEQVIAHDIKNFQNHFSDTLLINLYGQTESSINTMQVFNALDDGLNLTLGEPIGETEIVIINEDREEAELFEVGEIIVLSDSIALGYWNNKELTAKVFKFNDDRQNIYFTGDLGRTLENGEIEFLGRKDHQVKIRGFRIELGEIESRLLTLKNVREAVVVAFAEGRTDHYLCAYVVTDGEFMIDEMRKWLAVTLPDYMIPSSFMRLEKMPLTLSGKVDKKALPDPSGKAERGYEAPSNKIEELLVQIWAEVLEREQVGIYDNFFDLGGHSLKALMLTSKINSEFKVNIPLAEFYQKPFVSHIAEHIAAVKVNESKIDQGLTLLKKGEQAHKNMFFIHALGDTSVYVQLVNQIRNDRFNYWGVEYENLGAYYPWAVTIEELAAKYIKKIKRAQPEGPYYISGWSTGGLLAFEMAQQLEAMDDEIKFIGVYDSRLVSQKFKEFNLFKSSDFTINTEFKIINKVFKKYNLISKLQGVTAIESLWEGVVENLTEAMEIDQEKERIFRRLCRIDSSNKRLLEHYQDMKVREMLSYFNTGRSMLRSVKRYSSKAKIKAQISYFIGTKKNFLMRQRHIDKWSEHSHQGVNYYGIAGDHFTILEHEELVKEFAMMLTDILAKVETDS